jgi:hypothetical protein
MLALETELDALLLQILSFPMNQHAFPSYYRTGEYVGKPIPSSRINRAITDLEEVKADWMQRNEQEAYFGCIKRLYMALGLAKARDMLVEYSYSGFVKKFKAWETKQRGKVKDE